MGSGKNINGFAFTGFTAPYTILDANPDRDYICFYAKTGAPVVTIDGIAVSLSAGAIWEPRVAFTNAVTLTGASTELDVFSSGDKPNFSLSYAGYSLTYGAYPLTYPGV